jgi:hypothetical protein
VKFITRELYKAMQYEPGTPEEAVADAQWKSQWNAYHAHLESIRNQLPASMQLFCGVSLHDGVFTAAFQTSPETVHLKIDATNNPWGPTGCFDLIFTGVKHVSPLSELINEWWLYEEVHLHLHAAFDFRVLLTSGEFRVVADNVEFRNPLSSVVE